MFRSGIGFAAVLSLLLAAPSAHAQRTLEFAAYAVPDSGAVALAVGKDVASEGVFAEVDRITAGALRRAVDNAGYDGERGTTLNLHGVGPYAQVLLVGTGADAIDARLLEDVGGLVGRAATQSAAPTIEVLWPESSTLAPAAHLALGIELGQYALRTYKTPSQKKKLGEGKVVLRVADARATENAWRRDWQPVLEGVTFARTLVTEPANAMYPESFVERAQAAFKGVSGVTLEVLDVAAMEKLGMGSILAVGKGSVRPPRLLVVRYRGAGNEAPIAIVGKGITFDSGGISIKPSANMWKMKYDMAGAAAVTGTLLTLARREAKVNAIAVAALAENMPSGSASRPGDVVRTMSGKTYEIMSTDAEGRMVLVDAVWYVQEKDRPRVLIDIATLTGSQVTALGDEYGGLFTRDDALAAQLLAAGKSSGEEVWRLPLHPSYAKDLESPIADLRNGGSGSGAGAGVGAHFIGAWIKPELSWAHLDIASMAWVDESTPTVPKGASGYGVRLLDRYVREAIEATARP